MSEAQPPTGDGLHGGPPDERTDESTAGSPATWAAFLPIGVVFLTVGLAQMDEGNGIAFLVLGIAFLAMSAGAGTSLLRRADVRPDSTPADAPHAPPDDEAPRDARARRSDPRRSGDAQDG